MKNNTYIVSSSLILIVILVIIIVLVTSSNGRKPAPATTIVPEAQNQVQNPAKASSAPSALTGRPTASNLAASKLILQNIQKELGSNYPITSTLGISNLMGYKTLMPLPYEFSIQKHLTALLGQEIPSPALLGDRVEHAYENWHIICALVGLGSGSSSSAFPYIFCADKPAARTISVVVKDMYALNSTDRTFMLKIGNEDMKVNLPTVLQNTKYKIGTFQEFVTAVTSPQYQQSTFKMTGQLKGNVFEVTSIEWVLG